MTMRRVLFVSPHFPPDTSAGTHRARLLAPHLPAAGWEPTILTVDAPSIEGRQDPGLLALVGPGVQVERVRAWPAAVTRRAGLGDLGLRAYLPMRARAFALARRARFDAVAITIYPTYTALLGPRLRAAFGLPFVLDYQDPWVSEWGRRVGGGPGGRPDAKSRLTRALAERLEPQVVSAAAGLTAVSAGTLDAVIARMPAAAALPRAEIPLGLEPADAEGLDGVANPVFSRGDGRLHLVYVGTVLPLGLETLDAFLGAVAGLREAAPALAARLRIHFVGTANTTDPAAPARALPRARMAGVADLVSEHPPRLDYRVALRVQRDADVLLLLGSSEPHYTASKLFPALLARRPIVAAYHAASTVVSMLRSTLRSPSARVLTYDEARPPATIIADLREALMAALAAPVYREEDRDAAALEAVSARAMARRFGAVLDAAREAA